MSADPSEQAAYREIFALAGFGVPTYEIAATLTAEGYRPARGGKWTAQMVAYVLKHESQKAGS